ncbi:prephenate dehydrogenase [Pontiella agarivorans]|uniref:Prephenate dehydrogenase/arogenate dehydrogenase family protein n=1 Tax=Pontiella agarivorans TaxID=3038953 RepID=A0ABU5MTU1_9BACT|nr:prephenate dehydrogenase/arogenate dehydrogenase family protein [Pontiella agarivorans]MDZ8117511.1 prephenate dehydrogenase/arogenate dehydrogenase family protein [Pontiella agarivorans]
MDSNTNIAILGFGLMGASLALGLKKRGFTGRITGYARREETRLQALENGVADAVFADPADAVREADLVVICVPIWTIAKLAEQIVPALKPGAVVTDVGSTKSELLKLMCPLFQSSEAHFVGSHPIAGSEKTGIEAGNPDLYDGRLCIVCPVESTPAEANERVSNLWKTAGSEVVEMSPCEHDAMLASTSHLPHMIAAALARSVADGDPSEKADYCGTGFKDTTRVASGSADMWVDIIDTNRDALVEEIERFHDELQGLIQILRSGHGDDIRKWLEDARDDRDEILKLNRFLKR